MQLSVQCYDDSRGSVEFMQGAKSSEEAMCGVCCDAAPCCEPRQIMKCALQMYGILRKTFGRLSACFNEAIRRRSLVQYIAQFSWLQVCV